MSPNHTSLRYVRHVLAVATPTADCLASILDHLAPCLREHASGGLTATETNQMDGIRVAVEQLVGVCFQNYKNLSEDEPRGIAKQVPELQPAPALAIAVELNRILQKDPAAPEALRAFTAHLQTARARVLPQAPLRVSRRPPPRADSGSHADRQGHDGVSNARDDGHARLFAGLSQMCLGLCRELGVDHTIADAEVLPGGVRLPQIAAGVYCVEASACVSKLLSATPPPAPPGAEAIDLVDALCELQEAAVAADVSASPDAPFTTGRPEQAARRRIPATTRPTRARAARARRPRWTPRPSSRRTPRAGSRRRARRCCARVSRRWGRTASAARRWTPPTARRTLRWSASSASYRGGRTPP